MLQLILNASSAPGSLRPAFCIAYSMPLNWLYFLPAYYYKFHADTTQYSQILIGDSSMDYSARYPGFLSSGTQSVAVQGNKICDMLTQLPAINTTNPQAIIIGTPGGNDILDGIPNIYDSERELFVTLKALYPSSRIVVAGLPPTQSGSINAEAGSINSSTLALLQQIYPAGQFCFVDPALAIGNPPMAGALFDTVHYSYIGAMLLRQEIIDFCNITL